MLSQYVSVSVILFVIGVLGVVINRKNIIVMLMSIELLLLGVNFLFLIGAVFLDDMIGQVFSLYILVVAAAESAIGLSILIAYYRVKGTVAIIYTNLLRG